MKKLSSVKLHSAKAFTFTAIYIYNIYIAQTESRPVHKKLLILGKS